MSNWTDLSHGQFRNVTFEPNLPYIYIPDQDYLRFIESIAYNNTDMYCSYTLNFCKFKRKCAFIQDF